jgi:phytoene dehydrogenase-like protein
VSNDDDVVVVGAGMAGLACARVLTAAGRRCLVLEAGPVVGGRVATELVDGFRLDRGFQVLLTAYPTVRSLVDLEALALRPFEPGALVRRGGRFVVVADPLRRPLRALPTLLAPVGSLGDKLRVVAASLRARAGAVEGLFTRPETTTEAALASFSERMRESFWRPFLRGVLLDPQLATSSRFFEFVLRMFAAGDIAVPAEGMGELPRQLAARLPEGTVRLNSPVASVAPGRVRLASGEERRARHVVLATDPSAASRLLGTPSAPRMHGVTSLWFSAGEPPLRGAWLVLNGEGRGLVNHLAVMSEVAAGYAPAGQALVCVNVLGVPALDDEALGRAVLAELFGWFGAAVQGWRLLQIQRIPDALPDFSPPTAASLPLTTAEGLFVCGDHRATPSLEGAVGSGVRVAEALLA